VHFEGRFHTDLQFFDELQKWRHVNKPWIFTFLGESLFNHPFAGERDRLSHFNLTVGYDQQVYQEQVLLFLRGKLEEYTDFHPRPALSDDQGTAAVMMMVSNCRDKNGRLKFAQELMKYIKVDSFGLCLHNKNITDVLPEEAGKLDSWTQKAMLMRRYRFVIAFENANLPDYITEKLWEPLKHSIVPIYYGAPNVDEYLPGPKSIIKAGKYLPEDLARYLQTIMDNEDLYNSFFTWKTAPSEAFRTRLRENNEFFPVECGICQRMWEFYS